MTGSTKEHLNSNQSVPKCQLSMACLWSILVSPSFQMSHPICFFSCFPISVYRNLCSCFVILLHMYFIMSTSHICLFAFYSELPIYIFISILKITGDREVTQWLRALVFLAEGQVQFWTPTHCLTTAFNSSSRESDISAGHFGWYTYTNTLNKRNCLTEMSLVSYFD